jgi:hypothetical protein
LKLSAFSLSSALVFLPLFSCSTFATLYETHFDLALEGMYHDPPGEINAIEDGVLHLKGFKDGQPAHAGFEESFGSPSETAFNLKFAGPDDRERHLAMVSFLWANQDRFVVHFELSTLKFMMILGGEDRTVFEKPFKFEVGRWYSMKAVMAKGMFTFWIDEEEIGSIEIDPRLPEMGELNFEAHEEFYVDDIVVKIEG